MLARSHPQILANLARRTATGLRSRPALLLALLVAGIAASPGAASGESYKGTVDYLGSREVEFTIDNGVLTNLSTGTGRVDCTTTTDSNPTPVETDIDPLDVTPQPGPFTVVDGAFAVQTTGEDNYGHHLAVLIEGRVSPDRHRVDGTVTIDGSFDAFGKHYTCHDVQPMRALENPRVGLPPPKPNYTGSPVSFKYKDGRITRLRATVPVECPSGSVLAGQFDSTAYEYDPIRVDKRGKFALAASVFASGYDTIIDFTLTGRISGDKARGRITATHEHYRGAGQAETCEGIRPWKAAVASSSAPASGEPFAYYGIEAIRFGRPGDYDYWFHVSLGGCVDANRVSVRVLGHGKTITVPCTGGVTTEPLTPQRRYKIRITAQRTKLVRRNGQKVRKVLEQASVTESLYLPGPDGNWQQIWPRGLRATVPAG